MDLPIPEKQIDGYIQALDSVQNPVDLQAVVDDAAGSVKPVLDDLNAKLAQMSPWLALLQPPAADPGKIVKWLTDFIEGYLKAQMGPPVKLPLQVAALTAKTAELTAAIERAQSRLKCNVTIPPLV